MSHCVWCWIVRDSKGADGNDFVEGKVWINLMKKTGALRSPHVFSNWSYELDGPIFFYPVSRMCGLPVLPYTERLRIAIVIPEQH